MYLVSAVSLNPFLNCKTHWGICDSSFYLGSCIGIAFIGKKKTVHTSCKKCKLIHSQWVYLFLGPENQEKQFYANLRRALEMKNRKYLNCSIWRKNTSEYYSIFFFRVSVWSILAHFQQPEIFKTAGFFSGHVRSGWFTLRVLLTRRMWVQPGVWKQT